MKILITGGAGFIASHIADAYIETGHDVTIIDNLSTGKIENVNPKADFRKLDINDDEIQSLCQSKQFDVLNHHAAQMDVRVSVADPKFDARTNILGSLNLFEAARQNGIKKIIFASSGGTIYGEQEHFPADENHSLHPCSPYGVAKLTAENYLYYYKNVCGVDNACLRYGNVYGKRQNPHGEAGVIAIFLNKMLNGDQPVINGDGKITRDYVHVSDVVKANLLALKDDFVGAFNIGTSIESNVNYIFQRLKQLTGSSCNEFHGPAKPGEQTRSVLSFQKIGNLFGWKPEIDLHHGLELTYQFFKNKQ